MLSRVVYYLFLLPVSLLPFSLLYLLSDFVCFLLYHVFGYRKKVVFQNLRNSFPKKTEEERKEIARKFYKHLCDIILETVKSFTISPSQINKRVKVKNPEVLKHFYDKKQSVILITAHYGSWEWSALHLSLNSAFNAMGLYSPLKNKYFDNKMKSTRSKFGLTMVPNKQASEFFEATRDKLYAYGFVSDQSPTNPAKSHWTTFLNQTTAVFMGSEVYAKRYNYPCIFGKILKTGRGHYLIEYEVIAEDPSMLPEFGITEKHTRITEKMIQAQPEYWLWTHKRWKLKPLPVAQ